MMACEPAALMDQDTWLAALLTSKPTVAVDGDTLTITATDGTVVTFLDQAVANPDLPLEGTTWTVEGLVTRRRRVVDRRRRAGAEPCSSRAATVTVDTGCNTGSGTYTISGDATSRSGRSPRPGWRAPTPAGSATETAVLTVLTRHGVVGDRGRRAAADERHATASSLRAAPEGGTTPRAWRVRRGCSTPTSPARPRRRSPPGVQRPTLQFDATTGTVAVEAGCNTGSGSYTVAGDQITFGPLAMTMRACIGESATVETAVLAVLTGTATAQIVDGVLTLTNGSNGLHYLAG